jgi:beta-galactosidase GanA
MMTHTKGDTLYYFVLNHSNGNVRVSVPGVTGKDLLSEMTVNGEIVLKSGDVAVIKSGVI